MPFTPFYLPSYPGDFGPATVFLTGIASAEAIGTLGTNLEDTLTGIASEEAIGELTIHGRYNLDGFDASEPVTDLSVVREFVPVGVPFNRDIRPLTASERFSSQILNQNAAATDSIELSYDEDYTHYQEFYLPKDYIRGTDAIPPLTGFQLFTSIRIGYKDMATLDWTIERYEIGVGWTEMTSGTTIGNNIEGPECWFTVYADEPITLTAPQVKDKFRIGIAGRNWTTNHFKEEVPYDGKRIRIGIESYEAELVPGKPYSFFHNDMPVTVYLDPLREKVFLSDQTGISALWLTYPNPLATQAVSLTDSTGSPLTFGTEQASLNFRVLAGTAEGGKDFLGNSYRSVIKATDVNNATVGREASYWLSKPNPSKFAVESMYFDISDGLDRASTIDSILIDPITSGVHFNVYYSDEGEPTRDNEFWDRKLWTRLPQNFVAKQKRTHKLIRPITAKFIKVEFTHLQPQPYSAGSFQKPILYQKHPKWVLDYFLLRIAAEDISEDKFIGRNLEVSYNAYDLAYNYYLDDLRSQPDAPLLLDEEALTSFLTEREDASDQVDGTVLNSINLKFKQYTSTLANMAPTISYLPTTLNLTPSASGPIEDDRNFLPDPPTDVSTLDRDNLMYERSQAAMYFFVTCRHHYRMLSAKFTNNKGYFAGVNEISFLRDKYTKAYDSPMYVEAAGDSLNSMRNDFIIDDGILTP